jgi:hypothetical protein
VAPRLASPTPWLLLLCPFIARVARRPSLMRRASSRRFIARASPHIHVRVHLLSVLAVCGPCPSSPPAAESVLAQIPRSLGAIILQAAWDCCGIWPSPSRAHADPARFVAAHDPPRLLATPSPPPAPVLAIGTLAIGFTALFFICAARSRGSHIFAAAPGLPPAARAFGSDTDY